MSRTVCEVYIFRETLGVYTSPRLVRLVQVVKQWFTSRMTRTGRAKSDMPLYGSFVYIGGLQPISRDRDDNAAMYNCWWTNKRS